MTSQRRQPVDKNGTNSRAIIRNGVKSISASKTNANEKAIVHASTLRALQLRNGKGGSFGTGEVARIPGREKLELIAGDEMMKAREARNRNLYEANVNSSLRAPFRLETVLKIAQSQKDAYIDFINALRKPDLCYDIVSREIEAQCPPRRGEEVPELMRKPSFVAEQFGICVHNAYVLASGWVILYKTFLILQEMGLSDGGVLNQLKTDVIKREIYHSAYALLKKMVFVGQQRLRSIVRNTPHYAPYFKSANDSKECQEFEKAELKKMYSSFLDSAIIELCLPGSKFTPQAMYFCLQTSAEETPKLLKRCPQIMWDAVGDLAEAIRIMDILETPLAGRGLDLMGEGDSENFADYVQWNKAQAASIRAALQYSNFVNLVHPLTNLKNKSTLDKAWDRLNANYIRECGQSIDELWQLVDARRRVPHFSTLTISAENNDKALVLRERKAKPKAIMASGAREGEDSLSSMPELCAVSNSEDEFQESEDEDEWVSSSEEDDTTEDDEYDEELEQELKRLQREAIDKFLEDPAIVDSSNDEYAEERKSNPLLSLLGNLRGRLFSSSPILRTDGATTDASRATKKPAMKPKADGPQTTPEQGSLAMKTSVEDADDESDVPKGGAEKKKKKKHKKKKKKAATELAYTPSTETPASPVNELPRSPSPPPASEVTSPASPTSSRQGRKSHQSHQRKLTIQSPPVQSKDNSGIIGSTTTLPLPYEEKAPSARSYLQQVNEAKTKVKTRPDQPMEPTSEKKQRRTLVDRLKGKDRDALKEDAPQKNSGNIFGRLRRKTTNYARKLFGVSAQDKKGALKWEQFLQVMRELGFEYDPSTAGSSVRFDPPDPNDRSISFHKPHPDPTLHQNILKLYRDKLEAYYGLSAEIFEKAVEGLADMSGNDD